MKNQRNKWRRIGAVLLMILMVVQVVFGDVGSVTVQAAKKDKTKPNVTLYLDRTGYTRGSVNIMVRASDKSGIKSILIKKGNIKKSASKYWKNASNITRSKKKKVTANATYSVKVTDKAGNITIKRISVTNIDKKKPSIALSQTRISGGVLVTVKASDASGIKSVKWLKGGIDDPNSSKFKDAANITKTRNFTVTSNGIYTVQVVDKAGNKSVKQIQVTVKQALYDLDGGQYDSSLYDYYGKEMPKYASITDSLNRTYINAVGIRACLSSGSGNHARTFYLGGEYRYIEGDISAMYSTTWDGTFQIYADDELVYTSSEIRPETGAVHFKVDIQNARFIKLKVVSDYDYYDYILGNCYFYN